MRAVTCSYARKAAHRRLEYRRPITTASGLLFIGASNDRRVRAFDSRSGKELQVSKLDMNAHAVAITYAGPSRKQSVAIVVAAGSAVERRRAGGHRRVGAVRTALIGQV